MANQWFRLYAEFSTDQKVQMMTEADQRRLLMLFCARCNGNVTLQDSEVTFLMRISEEEWRKTKDIFISKNFINEENEVLHWEARQFNSDSSSARVAKHRLLKKELETLSNVSVTPQNRTEQNRTEQKKTCANEGVKKGKEAEGFDEFWIAYPKKKNKQDAQRAWNKLKPDQTLRSIILESIEKSKSDPQWIKNNGDYIPFPASWLNAKRWEDEEIEAPKPVLEIVKPKRYFN